MCEKNLNYFLYKAYSKISFENLLLKSFFGEHREKKFVTFEKINSFKRGRVRAKLDGLVTIMD